MSRVEIQEKKFIDENGITTPYKRLVIIGHLDGIEHSLEIKLTKNELVLAEALLRSNNLTVETNKGGSVRVSAPDGADISDDFFEDKVDSSGKIDLEEE